jgi:hypothetical protein
MFKLEEGQHRFTEINVLDESGAGGAYHRYVIEPIAGDTDIPEWSCIIHFQKGPVAESGKNGVFMEDLLQIVRHRLRCFQAGDFACKENAEALEHVEGALAWLNKRTADRQRRGVEGKNEQ